MMDNSRAKKKRKLLMWNYNFFNSYQDSALHEILEVSKSKKIIEVLSFVRTVLASLNKTLAVFSAKFSPSIEYLSLVCTCPNLKRGKSQMNKIEDIFSLHRKLSQKKKKT